METATWTLTGDPASALQAAAEALTTLGYTVTKQPDGWSGAAEVGSAAARAIVGGFARRNKVTFRVFVATDNVAYLQLVPMMTGLSGGVLGVGAAKKEHAKVLDAVNSHLAVSNLINTAYPPAGQYPSASTAP